MLVGHKSLVGLVVVVVLVFELVELVHEQVRRVAAHLAARGRVLEVLGRR